MIDQFIVSRLRGIELFENRVFGSIDLVDAQTRAPIKCTVQIMSEQNINGNPEDDKTFVDSRIAIDILIRVYVDTDISDYRGEKASFELHQIHKLIDGKIHAWKAAPQYSRCMYMKGQWERPAESEAVMLLVYRVHENRHPDDRGISAVEQAAWDGYDLETKLKLNHNIKFVVNGQEIRNEQDEQQ